MIKVKFFTYHAGIEGGKPEELGDKINNWAEKIPVEIVDLRMAAAAPSSITGMGATHIIVAVLYREKR